MRQVFSLSAALLIVATTACTRDRAGERSSSGGSSQAAPGLDKQGIGQMFGSAVRGPEVIVDEELAVSASGWQSRGFTLPSTRPIQVIAEGRKHADKGFNVYVIETSEVEKVKAGKSFQQISDFQGLKVRSFGHTGNLQAGSWTVLVANSENIVNTMVVHLRVVADPS